jgi:hypothetical protein
MQSAGREAGVFSLAAMSGSGRNPRSPPALITAQAFVSARCAHHSVDGDTLRFTMREGQQLTAPLSSVDRRFSEQINRERNVEFRLP